MVYIVVLIALKYQTGLIDDDGNFCIFIIKHQTTVVGRQTTLVSIFFILLIKLGDFLHALNNIEFYSSSWLVNVD